jgi:hypothetical protein
MIDEADWIEPPKGIAERKRKLANTLRSLHDLERPESEDCLRSSIEYLREIGSDVTQDEGAPNRLRALCDDALRTYGGVSPSDDDVLLNSATPDLVRYVLAALRQVRDGGTLDGEWPAQPEQRRLAIERAQRAVGTSMGLAGGKGDKRDFDLFTPELREVYRVSSLELHATAPEDRERLIVEAIAKAYREKTRKKPLGPDNPEDDPIVFARYRRDAEEWLATQRSRGHL